MSTTTNSNNTRQQNSQAKGTRWCLTINLGTDAPDADESCFEDRIAAIGDMYRKGELIYAVGSFERGGETNRLHVQAYLMFKRQVRWTYVVSRVSNSWAEVQFAKSDQKLRDYCDNPEKDGYVSKAFEYGKFPSVGAGRRSDLLEAKSLIDSREVTSFRELNDRCPTVTARHPQWANYTLEERARDAVREHRLSVARQPDYVWQHWLRRYITELPVDDRKIIFVVGKLGNEGKSSFLRTLALDFDEDFQLLRPSKKADMVEAVKPTCKVLAIDIARGQSEHIGHVYPFLEEIKDGEVFNPKYNSRMKPVTPCHVLVMMNSDVDYGQFAPVREVRNFARQTQVDDYNYYTMGIFPKDRGCSPKGVPPLSADRYLIWELGESHLETWSEDHPRWGRECPPFRSFTRDWDMVPYHPPFVADHGPQFNGDNAGDGPAYFLPGNALGVQLVDSQETRFDGMPRYEFIPVLVAATWAWDSAPELSGDHWRVTRRDDPFVNAVIGSGSTLNVEEWMWYDILDSSPEWTADALDRVAGHLVGQFGDADSGDMSADMLTYAHIDNLPEEVLVDHLIDGWSSDQILIQLRVISGDNPLGVNFDAYAIHAAAA